jgi:hypothetical protein
MPCAQEPTTGPHNKPVKSNQRPYCFLEIYFDITTPPPPLSLDIVTGPFHYDYRNKMHPFLTARCVLRVWPVLPHPVHYLIIKGKGKGVP